MGGVVQGAFCGLCRVCVEFEAGTCSPRPSWLLGVTGEPMLVVNSMECEAASGTTGSGWRQPPEPWRMSRS